MDSALLVLIMGHLCPKFIDGSHLFKNYTFEPGSHACNPSYSGSRDQEDQGPSLPFPSLPSAPLSSPPLPSLPLLWYWDLNSGPSP
jgi:hypothetical protein